MSSVKRENTVADPGAKGSKESARDAWPLSVQIRSFWCRLTPPPQGWRHRLGSPGSATETLPVSFKVGNKNSGKRCQKTESSWFCQPCPFLSSKHVFIKYINSARISVFDDLAFQATVTTELIGCFTTVNILHVFSQRGCFLSLEEFIKTQKV